jgi:hypothetical protein
MYFAKRVSLVRRTRALYGLVANALSVGGLAKVSRTGQAADPVTLTLHSTQHQKMNDQVVQCLTSSFTT